MKCSALGLGALAVVLSAGSVQAQAADSPHTAPVKFGIEGGATIPLSPLSDGYKTGFNGGVVLDFHVPSIPFGLRLDGMYHQLGSKVDGGPKLKMIGGDLDAVFSIPTSSAVQPYVLGGVGVYNVKVSGDNTVGGDASQTKFAFNAGAGLRADISGFGAFIEGRFLDVLTSGGSVKVIPIDIGVMFGKF